MNKINVLIIDDSAVVRDILETRLSGHPRINVVASAMDPYIAREKIAAHHVDVITLDIEMPRMDGLSFLRYLMKYHPLPVIIVSSLVDNTNQAGMTALELGAVDIVPKPGGRFSVEEIIEELTEKIITASEIDFEKIKEAADKNRKQTVRKNVRYLTEIDTTDKLIAVGASTGGTTALETLFKSFTRSFPPTLTVIHMPERFTAAFAARLNDVCDVDVKEAVNGERLVHGTIYIAPGDYHLLVKAVGTQRTLRIIKGPKVQHQRPAVDVLFDSVAEHIGKNAVAVLLTGMGKDGAEGLLKIRNKGGYTIAQDERTSIVFGMPRAAIELGAANVVKPLGSIAGAIAQYLGRP